MKAAKIFIEAPVVSFRYPHFLIGRQITFDMPPPSTVYGHIASAVGEWLDPSGIRFAYNFCFEAKGSDLEYQHIVSIPDAKRPDAKRDNFFISNGEKHRVSIAGIVQPHLRDFLYNCQMTLYLAPAELGEAFREPVFCVNLGRSQDLAKISGVEEIELTESDGTYLEHTLLPFSYRKFTAQGVTALMPRFITPPPEREPTFERYVILHERIFAGNVSGSLPRMLEIGMPRKWLVDPGSPEIEGVFRGVVLHSFQGEVI